MAKSWRHRRTYLFPLDMMADVFRAKMLDALRLLRRQGAFSGYPGFEDPEAFERLTSTLAGVRWIVFAKRPFRRPEHVLRYLGRYTHRVALSNSRLLDVTPTAVTFRTRGEQTATLTPVEFLRRFVQHILPDGFHKIRHHGLYAPANAHTRWPRARDLLEGAAAPVWATDKPPRTRIPPTWQEHLLTLTGRDVRHCRRCGGLVSPEPLARAPPAVAA